VAGPCYLLNLAKPAHSSIPGERSVFRFVRTLPPKKSLRFPVPAGRRLSAVLLTILLLGGGSCGPGRGSVRSDEEGAVRTAPSPPLPPARLERALMDGRAYLMKRQHPQGYWLGTLFNDSSVTGVYILLAHYTGQVDARRQAEAVRFLLQGQGPDGGWEQYPGSGGNRDVTLINATALHAAGLRADHEALVRAQRFLLGPVRKQKINFFTKIFLAMFGQVPWEDLPWVSCRLMEHPSIIYRQGFPRVIVVPYMVLYENRRVMEMPPFFEEAAADPPSPAPQGPWRLRTVEPPFPAGGRMEDARCREQCIEWILERQEVDGTWAGVVQATAFSAMALAASDPVAFAHEIQLAVRGVESYQVEVDGGRMQSFSQGPVMDTAHSVRALLEAGVPSGAPSVQCAVRWLVEQQSLREGDWVYGNPQGPPGGWPFAFHNSWYPDVDDTAMVLTALAMLDPRALKPVMPAVERGLVWMLSMQNRDGGFPVWDKDNWAVFNLLKSLFDVGDYSHADVTARVLVALSGWRGRAVLSGGGDVERAIRSGRSFLLEEQEDDGSWYGRWGANYTYGTGQVLEGLLLTGSRATDEPIRRAVDWLFSVQNPDGGWGESLESYATGRFEPAESTVAQSAAVLAGLMHAGVRENPRFRRGVLYLLGAQQPDGSWQDRLFYAVNVPRAWYGRYELLSTQAALTVLAGIGTADPGISRNPRGDRGKEALR